MTRGDQRAQTFTKAKHMHTHHARHALKKKYVKTEIIFKKCCYIWVKYLSISPVSHSYCINLEVFADRSRPVDLKR